MSEKKYTITSNIRYALKNIWSWDKMFYFWFFPAIPLEVIVPLMENYFPKLIIDGIEAKVSIKQIAGIIVLFFILLFLADTWKRFCKSKRDSRRYYLSNMYQYKIIEKLLRMDYSNVDNPKIMEKYWRAMGDTYGACGPEIIWELLLNLGINLLGIITYGSIIFFVSPVILVCLFVSAILIYLYGRYRIRYMDRNRQKWVNIDRKKDYIASFSRDFDYAKEIRINNMSGWLDSQFGRLIKESYAWTKRITRRSLAGNLLQAVLLLIQNGLAYWILCTMLFQSRISIGEFTFYFSAITGFSAWLNNVIYGVNGIIEQGIAIGYYRDYFDVKDKYNHAQGHTLPTEGELPLEIEFEHVYFKYEGAEEYLFKDLSFKINKGEKIAIVGENGAGKTTLIKLLCGLYFPSQGSIRINGVATTEFNIEEYYSLFSIVFQDIYLFPITIREFIASSSTVIDEEKVELVLKQAGLWDKVCSLEKGTDTKLVKGIYEDSIELSGGEEQKLMLARAMYKDAAVVILDEPTSALDPIAESRLYEQYNDLVKQKTSIYISHRLASTSFCDRIFLLEKGKITETGTHNELLKKKV